MCENCNPLGLTQPAPSQAHGTVFVAIVGAVIGLAILGRLALSGIGPFAGHVGNVVSVPPGLAVTLTVTNKGTSAGSTTCRIYDAGSTGLGPEPRSSSARRTARAGRSRSRRRSRSSAARSARSRSSAPGRDRRRSRRAMRSGPSGSTPARRVGASSSRSPPTSPCGRASCSSTARARRAVGHKSAKDVVTEVDHLSEALIIEAIRATVPGRRDPGRGVGCSARVRTDDGRTLGHRPARRDDRTTPTGSRSSASRSALVVDGRPARRRHPRPHAGGDVRGGRAAARRRWTVDAIQRRDKERL